MERTSLLAHWGAALAAVLAQALCLPHAAGAADKAAWGKAAGGIALGLSLSTEEAGYGEDFTITFHIRNTHTAPIRLIALDTAHSSTFGHYHAFSFEYRRVGGARWHPCQFAPPVVRGDKVDTLKAGGTRRVVFHAGKVVSLGTWPPMPGRYVVRARFSANWNMKKAKAAGLWTDRTTSGERMLTVPPFAFLDKVADSGKISQEKLDALYLSASHGTGPRAVAEQLIGIGDRKACLMLIRMMRDRVCPPKGVEFLAGKCGDALTYDLVRLSQAQWAKQTRTAGRCLGRFGTKKAIGAVEELLKGPLWSGRIGFIRGLGESATPESLALLGTLATGGSAEAVAALGNRKEEKARALLLEAMSRGKAPADSHAARILAARGSEAAVRWLSQHWHWLNAAAFIAAPIQWAKPGEGMLTEEKAMAIARRALPALRRPEARFLDGKWHFVSVGGHPQMVGRFTYVIVNAANGNVVAKDDFWVRR